MSGACSAYRGEERRIEGFGGETWGKYTTWETQAWGGGHLWMRYRTLGFHKMPGISVLAENRLASLKKDSAPWRKYGVSMEEQKPWFTQIRRSTRDIVAYLSLQINHTIAEIQVQENYFHLTFFLEVYETAILCVCVCVCVRARALFSCTRAKDRSL